MRICIPRRLVALAGLTAAALTGASEARADYSTRDASGRGIYLCGSGSGTTTDPYVPCQKSSPGTLADCSGTIATGGSSQSLVTAATSPQRGYLLLQNISSGNLGLKEGTGASIGSAGTITVAPGGSIVFEGSFVPQNAFSIVGPTTGQVFTCKRG